MPCSPARPGEGGDQPLLEVRIAAEALGFGATLLLAQPFLAGRSWRAGFSAGFRDLQCLPEQVREALGDLLSVAMLASRGRTREREQTLSADPPGELLPQALPLLLGEHG